MLAKVLRVTLLLGGMGTAHRLTVSALAVLWFGGVNALILLPSFVRARDRVSLGEGSVGSKDEAGVELLRCEGDGEDLRLAAGEMSCWGDGAKGESWPQCMYEGDLSYLRGEDMLEPGGVWDRVRAKSIEGVLQGLVEGVVAAVGVFGLPWERGVR